MFRVLVLVPFPQIFFGEIMGVFLRVGSSVGRQILKHKVLAVATVATIGTYAYFDWPKPLVEGIAAEVANLVGLSEKVDASNLTGEYKCTRTGDYHTDGKTYGNVSATEDVKVTARGDGRLLLEETGGKVDAPEDFPPQDVNIGHSHVTTSILNGSTFGWFFARTDQMGFGTGTVDDGTLSMFGYKAEFFPQQSRVDTLRFTLECVPKGHEEPTIKGVFIRPCPGLLYKSVADSKTSDVTPEDQRTFYNGSLVVKVGGGTLYGVCSDLRDSGVTDIFIPFRVDDAEYAPSCGLSGQLLYDSQGYGKTAEVDRRSAGFATVLDKGLDPIGSLITECRSVYREKDKEVRFHVWFPVFKDPYAAQIEGVRGRLKFDKPKAEEEGTDKSEATEEQSWLDIAIQTVVDYGTAIFDPEYTSHLYAEPSNADVQNEELGILHEIVDAYGVDGINLDYVRYPGIKETLDVSAPGQTTEPIHDPREDQECTDENNNCIATKVIWSSDQLSVAGFVDRVNGSFSSMIISADVFSSETSRISVGQTLIPGKVEWVMPMIYTGFGGIKPEDVSGNIRELLLLHPGVTVVPDLRGWPAGNQTSSELEADLFRDITAAKDAGAAGYSLFTYDALLSATKTKLKAIKDKIGF